MIYVVKVIMLNNLLKDIQDSDNIYQDQDH